MKKNSLDYDFLMKMISGMKQNKNGKTRKQIIDESGNEGLIDLYWNLGGNVTETGYINKKEKRFKKLPKGKN